MDVEEAPSSNDLIKCPFRRLSVTARDGGNDDEQSDNKSNRASSPSNNNNKDPSIIFSGGGISFLAGNQNRRFSYGYSSFQGKRSTMEDFYETRIQEVDGQMVAFFGVFDGHGGSRAAEYLKNHLFKNLTSHPGFIKDTESAIAEAFVQTDTNFIEEEKGQQKDAGSTASTVVLLGHQLLVANVGDSRVVACRCGSDSLFAVDQINNPRMEWMPSSKGKDISKELSHFLPIIHSIKSQLQLQILLFHCPMITSPIELMNVKELKKLVDSLFGQEEEIDSLELIIIASDGLWNVVSKKEAVDMVREISVSEAASKTLVNEAYSRGSSDNITCIVIRFAH